MFRDINGREVYTFENPEILGSSIVHRAELVEIGNHPIYQNIAYFKIDDSKLVLSYNLPNNKLADRLGASSNEDLKGREFDVYVAEFGSPRKHLEIVGLAPRNFTESDFEKALVELGL